MSQIRPEARLEEKIDKLTAELEIIRSLLSSIPVLPEKLSIENLSVGQIDFNLENINIQEVSGALNIGITHGINLTTKKGNSTGISKSEEKTEYTVATSKSRIKSTESKINPPKCKINFG